MRKCRQPQLQPEPSKITTTACNSGTVKGWAWIWAQCGPTQLAQSRCAPVVTVVVPTVGTEHNESALNHMGVACGLQCLSAWGAIHISQLIGIAQTVAARHAALARFLRACTELQRRQAKQLRLASQIWQAISACPTRDCT